jgi:hypothetical protein
MGAADMTLITSQVEYEYFGRYGMQSYQHLKSETCPSRILVDPVSCCFRSASQDLSDLKQQIQKGPSNDIRQGQRSHHNIRSGSLDYGVLALGWSDSTVGTQGRGGVWSRRELEGEQCQELGTTA